MSSERKLEWLEAMRGFAALWVLIHHAGQATDHFVGSTGGLAWIEHGYLGVDFFFVLSGFIIAFASQRLVERGGGFKQFLQARLLRIYVPYLPVGVGMLALYQVLPSLSEGGRDVSLVSSLTLLPANHPPALSVAWTLVHEVIFYAIYSLWFLHRRAFYLVLVAWIASILCVVIAEVNVSRLLHYFLSPLNLCFILGVGIFRLTRAIEIDRIVAVLVGLVGVLVLGFEALMESPNRISTTAAFGLLVLAAASRAAMRYSVWRPLLVLGGASYSVYLVHNPVVSMVVRGVIGVAPNIGVWPAFVIVVSIAAAAGLMYWRWYEVPMLNWLRARLMAAPSG